jgi:hypothetical protein
MCDAWPARVAAGMASRIVQARLRLLYVLFKLGVWSAEAVGEWMVRLANWHRAIARYEGSAERAVVVLGGSMTLVLWGITRLTFLGLYRPTHRLQRVLSAAGW